MINIVLQNILYIILIILILGFSLWSKPETGLNLSPDSYDYINLAKNLDHEISKFRPLFFSIILRFFMELESEKRDIYISNFQLIAHSFLVLLCFFIFQKVNLSKTSSFILCLGIGFNPSLLYYASYVLLDFLLGLLTTLLWTFSLFYFEKKGKKYDETGIKYIIIIGSLCGLISITKPIGTFLFTLIILGIFMFREKHFFKSIIIIT